MRRPPSHRQNVAVSVEAAERTFAALALVAAGGALLLVASRWIATPFTTRVLAVTGRGSVWLAWLVAAVATGGSLYFSEYAGFTPCELCWYQRIAMYPSAVVLLVAALRRDRGVRWYVVPVAGLGAIVSTYHYLIEWHPEWETTECSALAPCSVPWFRSFGFVSLSLMALCGFVAIIVVLVVPPTGPVPPIDRGEPPDAR